VEYAQHLQETSQVHSNSPKMHGPVTDDSRDFVIRCVIASLHSQF
jgi:hypothetical protein